MASSTSRAVAATALRQPGHPEATESNCFERYVTGHGIGPTFGVRAPRAIPCFSEVNTVKSLLRSGIPRAGALVRMVLIWSNALCKFPVQSSGSMSSPFKASYNGFAMTPNLGIQIL